MQSWHYISKFKQEENTCDIDFFALHTGYYPLLPSTLILVPKTLSPSSPILSRGWIYESIVEWFLSKSRTPVLSPLIYSIIPEVVLTRLKAASSAVLPTWYLAYSTISAHPIPLLL